MSRELRDVQALAGQPVTRRPRRAAVLASVALALLFAGWVDSASATTFKVNNRRDKVDANIGDGRCDADLNKSGKQCTLRAASQEANSDKDSIDTIKVPKGLYKLTIPSDSCGDDESCGDIDLDGKVSLVGAGPFKAVIDARRAKDRGLELHPNTFGCKPPPKHFPDYGDYCLLTGIGVKNGNPTGGFSEGDGGGMLLNGTLLVTHVAAWRNNGRDGGGINLSCTCYKFNHVTTNHNKARANGGGLYMFGDTITHMIQVDVKGNRALGTEESDCCGDGGGIFFQGNTLYDVKHMYVKDNIAEDRGGGMFANGDTDWFHWVKFNHNKAKGDGGGGIYLSGTYFFFGFEVHENRAPHGGAHGGGIFVDGATNTLTRGTIAHNSVGQGGDGGGFYAFGTDYWANDTVTGNRAPGGRGGGIFNDSSSEYLDNVTLASNRAPTGANLWNDAYTAFLNTIVAYGSRHNCDGGGTYDDRGHNLDSGHSCHFDRPSDLKRTDPRLLGLRDNGNFSLTRALRRGSPAIDRGKDRKLHWTLIDAGFGSVYPYVYGNGFPEDMGCAETNLDDERDDQRLVRRPQRKHCDIGAFEARRSRGRGSDL